MTGRYWSRNLSWKWGSLGQEEGYFQLTWRRRGAKGMGSTTKPSGGSGLTVWERTGSPRHTRLPHRRVLGSPLPPRAGCPGDGRTDGWMDSLMACMVTSRRRKLEPRGFTSVMFRR